MGGRTKIEWTDSTISPVRGCSRGCPYCYARKMNVRFKYVEDFSKPQFFPKALEQPYKWKKPRIIFVCSMGELFDPGVSPAWIHRVFAMMWDNPRHRFLLLTKQPMYASPWMDMMPSWALLGESITRYTWGDPFADPAIPHEPHQQLSGWSIAPPLEHFISFEPLLGPAAEAIDEGTMWIIIGAQTNPNVQPKRVWVQEILNAADDARIPVLMKHNLEWPGRRRFEFPADLEKIRSER